MKKYTVIISFLIGITHQDVFAQVPKKVVVEHFTNTRCTVCSGKNPGLYTNLDNFPAIYHLAVHPSAPYATCLLNQHNVAENDARTNYYGVYGGTPRAVIQGSVIASLPSYSAASLFTPFMGQTSPASIKMTQTKFGNDSIRTRIVLKTEATHTLGGLKLFVALAEDTVFYASPNGETRHYDVFRKSLGGATGMSVTLPGTVGDSLVVVASSTVHIAWNFARIYALAILQEAGNKAVVQTETATPAPIVVPTSVNNQDFGMDVKIFPNPVNNMLQVHLNNQLKSVAKMYDLSGKIIYTGSFENKLSVDLSQLSPGQYILVVENSDGKIYRTIVKE